MRRWIFVSLISVVTLISLQLVIAYLFDERFFPFGVFVWFFSYLSLYFILGPLLLSLVKGRRVYGPGSLGDSLQKTIAHWSYKLQIEPPRVYTTKLLGSNFFVLHGPLNQRSIVFGEALTSGLSEREMEIIVEVALIAIKTKESSMRYIQSVLLFPVFTPYLLANIFPRNISKFLVRIISFYLFPFEMSRIAFFKNAKSYERLDNYILKVGLDHSRFNALILNLSKKFHHPQLGRLTVTVVDNLLLFDPPEYETAMGTLLYSAEVNKRILRLTTAGNNG